MITDPKLDTKQRLFKAAIEVFAAKGFQGATVRAICERAEANVAAINYHYQDKEHLYAQVLEHIFRSPRTNFGALRPDLSGATPEERLREFIFNFFHEVYDCGEDEEQCANLAAIYLMEMAHPSPKLDDIVEQYIRPDSEVLNDIIRDYFGPGYSADLRGYCVGAVIAQALNYCTTGPIIERLHPGEGFRPEMIEPLAELAFQFTIGGMARFKSLPQISPAPLK